MRKWSAIIGTTCLALGFIAPVIQDYLIKAASSLDQGAFWAMLLVLSIALAGTLLLLAIPKNSSLVLNGLRGIFLALGTLVVLFQIYNISFTVWLRAVAPRAVVIVPDAYSGLFGISIANFLVAGPRTAGKVFSYNIPSNGILEVSEGWIGLNFTGGPDPYTTQIQTTAGKTISPSCEYVTGESTVRKTSMGWSGTSKMLGVVCMIGPGQNSGTRIPYVLRRNFIDQHFKKLGAT